MIIYFDFDNYQTKFIKQQNEQKSFAVDFLMEKSFKKDFVGIITDVLSKNPNIVDELKSQKNLVILPDQVVGFGHFKVPTAKWGKNKFAENYFNMIYNKQNDMVADFQLFEKEHDTSTFLFAMTKKKIVDDIVETFKKFSIDISGITYFSKVFAENFFEQNRQLAKENLVINIQDKVSKLYAFSHGKILGYQKVEKEKKSAFARKYVKYIKSRESFDHSNIDKEIGSVKIDSKSSLDELSKNDIMLTYFAESIKNNDLRVNLDKIYYLCKNLDKNSDTDSQNLIVKEYNEEVLLSKISVTPFYSAKGKWWKL